MTNQEVMSQQQRALGFAVEGRFNEALSIIEQNIRQHPGNSGNYYIKGRIHDELLQYESSITAYKKCLRKDKKNKKAKFNLSLAYLSLENFKEGCSFYHFRHSDDVISKFNKVQPWYPKCKPGKVLIWAEQGIGDEVMFAQLIGNLAAYPHQFSLECDVRLHKILSANYAWLGLIARNSVIDLDGFDYQFPVGNFLVESWVIFRYRH
jgi:tetratricopeptide (TPR) repeat protein